MTETDANGQAWQIRTSKGRAGVHCTAVLGERSDSAFSYDLFGAKKLDLGGAPGRCTEKLVNQVHTEGLEAFKKYAEENEPKEVEVIGAGQILFTDGYADQRKRAICEILAPGKFRTVLLDGSGFVIDNRVKPIEQKFGIGTYYNKGEKLGTLELQELVDQATKKEAARIKAKEDARNEAARVKAEHIEAGKKIISEIPAGAVAVIVAEKQTNTSDSQSDYHGHTTDEVHYLAFSGHKRDLFSEMRKAADVFEPVHHLGTGNQDESLEHREKYSMGAGYYLGKGHSDATGWIVRKMTISENYLETIQIAAGAGKFHCNEFSASATEELEPVEVSAGTVQIIEYSPKAIAVIGDTKPIKDLLGRNGLRGKFNTRLSCGAGWIFPKTRFEEVQKALKNHVRSKREEQIDPAGAMVEAEQDLNANYSMQGYV